MNKKLFWTIIAIFIPMMMNGQTYSSLWKQVSEAEQKDLPQTEQEVLSQIVKKAEQEGNYGQLLKSELQYARSQCTIAPDSLLPAVQRLKQREEQAASNHILQAIYQTVLGYIYEHNNWLDELGHEEIARQYYDKAMSHPDELASVKAIDYEPFVVKGPDSRYFDDDLLSVIGYETRHFDVLRDYYLKTGDRRAALLVSIELLAQQKPQSGIEQQKKSSHLQRLDSLISEYADLVECGEVAIQRYQYMSQHTDATAEQKWQYINYALDHWGSWQRMNVLRNAQRDLTALQFEANIQEEVTIPQREQTVKLTNLRGISELTMKVYKVNLDGGTELNPQSTYDFKIIKPLLKAMPEQTVTRKFVGKRAYEFFEDSMQVGKLPVGVYMLEFETQPATRVSRSFYFVSDLRVLVQSQPEPAENPFEPVTSYNKQMRIVVVNATSGQPVKGASLDVAWGYQQDDNNKTTLTTDQNGECTLQHKDDFSNYRFRPHTGNDNACPVMNCYGQFSYNPQKDKDIEAIFTDRSIYRPGQTVHAAVISYIARSGNDQLVNQDKKLTMMLYDANMKMVEEKTVTTDKFGTAAADFVLPAQGLTGRFSINVNGQQHFFMVEEYKRPAFEVDIPAVTRSYEDGDTVVARGNVRSYAGVPVQAAVVKYKVVRRSAFWWMSYSNYWNRGYLGSASDDELLAEGETVTDEKGQFTVDMPMVLPMTKYPMFYNFVLTADVTDQAGETHQGSLSLPLGNRKTAFSVSLPEKVLTEQDTKIAFHQQNAAGIDLDATVRYRFDNGRWQETKTNTLLSVPAMKSGKHALQAICDNDTLKQDFIVFSLEDHQPATDVRSWFYTSHEHFPLDGGPVTVQAGSSDKNVHVVYSVINGNRLLESGTANLSNELINRKFTYDERYEHGLLLTFAWVKEGKYYTYTTTIKKPVPDKHLDLKWKTFRNRLTPGQQEEWTLAITKPDGTPAEAQLMGTLYDMSLDQLHGHGWNLWPPTRLTLADTQWQKAEWGSVFCNGFKHQGSLYAPSLRFNSFDTGLYPEYGYGRHRILRSRVLYKGEELLESTPMMEQVLNFSATNDAMPAMVDVAAQKTMAASGIEEVEQESGNDESAQTTAMQIRENLQETAFFYPQMVTDSTGNVSIKFTLPESLTTWRFLGVAHTQDMMYGQLADQAVASKDVMIQPNMPRFIRQGDKASISARIMNMSNEPISGTAMLQLLDPETESVILEQSQQVSVADSTTVGVTFPVSGSLPQLSHHTLLIARVSIVTPKHSDGEQHYLPLLPNTERVTLTVPFTQNGPGTKEIDLTKLFPQTADLNAPTSKLTVEYTNNPAWLMIQALPTIGHPDDDCAICQAVSYYSNSIGQHILKQNPQAKHVFEQWKQEELAAGADASLSSLHSSLQKNQELKDLLLNETPWVLDADQEKDQKEQLADFFDANTIAMRQGKAIELLQGLQNKNGAWSWMPGMKGSATITITVSELLVRLHQMTDAEGNTKKMLDRSFEFLGKDAIEQVKWLKEQERKGFKPLFPGHNALHWLYICAIDGRELPKEVEDANIYLKNLLKKDTKNQTIYEKALSAIILNNKTYIKSLKEYTVFKEGMGRYYDTQRASYSWRDYKIPTQVAAIEAIRKLTPEDTTTIGEMQQWLLQQKRTQAWDTPINSADAVYAFLNGNSQALAPQAQTTLAIDGKAIDTSEATRGLGYVKNVVPAKGATSFKAQKTSKGTSWGALYAQFTQPSADVADQGSGLTVKRAFYLRDAAGKLTEIDGQKSLHVGDRVIARITIEAERDYDFVQLQDKRAACMEPVRQLSGYDWRQGYYCSPKDFATCYYFDLLSKGRHIIETEYFVDREGTYQTGTCIVQCAYSPEFRGTTKSVTLQCVKSNE